MSRIGLTTKEFIKKSKIKFGNKFRYDDTVYKNGKTKIIICCSLHGTFEIYPFNHLKGTGCPGCSRVLNGENHRLNTNSFVERATKIHNNFYVYDKTMYTGSLKNVIITCPIHGEFETQASRHINMGVGCSRCKMIQNTSTKNKINFAEFIKKISSKKNYEKYIFSDIREFKNKNEFVIAECIEHGKYKSKPKYIENSIFFGCRKCKLKADKTDTETFILRSSEAHNNFYSYKNSVYTEAHTDIIVTCPKHGDYVCKPYVHIIGGGFCPVCSPTISSYEKQIRLFLDKNGIKYEPSFRNFKEVKEIDIINHDNKIGIEFNGLYWHSNAFKDKNYHLAKTEAMSKRGYVLLHIFEDEWTEKRAICESIILNAFNKTRTKIFARKCEIKQVGTNEAKEFLKYNHIQGSCVSKYKYGLYYKHKLVMLLTLGKNRKCLGSKSVSNEFELLRLCSALHSNVVGGASKLLKHFIKLHNPNKITSYCNRRYGTGLVYTKLGFEFVYNTAPNYFYVRGNKRINRFCFRKDKLITMGYDKRETESSITTKLGYSRIYDCGSMKFIWTS
jgi:hypothetical protein